MMSDLDSELIEHNWFAWFPVITCNHTPSKIIVKRVWLTTVKRKLVAQPGGVFAWTYRL